MTMIEGNPVRSLPRKLASLAVLLALMVLVLALVGLANPEPGLIAQAVAPRESPPISSLSASSAISHTAYLPFITRPDEAALNVWQAEYYSNMNLNGEPARTAEEKRVDYDWGEGGPSGVPADFFSARWTGDWEFETGRYTFWIDVDDGARLWLDDKELISAWSPYEKSEMATTIVQEGRHRLKLEYYEQGGDASIRLHWRRTDLYPWWEGTYYRLPWAESGKMYTKNDAAIQFEWGEDCPEGLYLCDGFSVAWEAEPVFITGTHRIYVFADDGYQLYMDGTLLQEGGWYDGQDGGREDDYYQLEFSQTEQHEITYKFQDRGGLAEARLWLQDMEHPKWTVEYYNNMELGGAPSAVKTDSVIFHDWQWGKPDKSVYSDRFSVRWIGQRTFPAGCYRFGVFADDGVRLWVDGELLIDEWHDGRDEYYAPATYLTSGEHEIIVEYYENQNEAEIRFWW